MTHAVRVELHTHGMDLESQRRVQRLSPTSPLYERVKKPGDDRLLRAGTIGLMKTEAVLLTG